MSASGALPAPISLMAPPPTPSALPAVQVTHHPRDSRMDLYPSHQCGNHGVSCSSPTSPVYSPCGGFGVSSRGFGHLGWPKSPPLPQCNGHHTLCTHHKPGCSKPVDARLVVLGNAGVGKSALVVRFLTRRFIWEYDPTLECVYRYCGSIADDDHACIEILDTAGQGDPIQQDGYFRWSDGFLLVYSITDRCSFEEVAHLHRSIVAARRVHNLAFVVVGNKNDLTHERQVTFAEGEQMAADLGCAFFEVSACDGSQELYDAFWELHRDVLRRRTAFGRRRRSSAQQVIQAFNKMLTKING